MNLFAWWRHHRDRSRIDRIELQLACLKLPATPPIRQGRETARPAHPMTSRPGGSTTPADRPGSAGPTAAPLNRAPRGGPQHTTTAGDLHPAAVVFHERRAAS